ncbi:restriction endonuclease subunit S [Moritella sp.]|uniref:restriction endonuclease subunit S n=1 Tax=Moritella sp. TaxID=78556 RepID=UPI0025F97792|nr:restriction endonuclease subunit S [Moritella sp.]MCJ8352327.1 restriction endonuclease subunit S [Moritella sp.]
MTFVSLSEIFDVEYGNSLELNKLVRDDSGINFVSRTAKNNGVSAKVEILNSIKPTPEKTITVALGGSVLSTFLQPEPFYSGYHIFCLTPKYPMSDEEKLFYCSCIEANKYRYNYGRQANRTLRGLRLPSRENVPEWISKEDTHKFDNAHLPFNSKTTYDLNTKDWKFFRFDQIFNIKKGKRLIKANMLQGNTPFIGAIDSNNGLREFIGQDPIHEKNTITVNYNGNGVAEAFYQNKPYWCSDDVNVLYPKFALDKFSALFLCSIITKEKYRFSYGRKWHVERMNRSRIKIPVDKLGNPDYEFMGDYIKSLPFSNNI